MDFQTPLIFVGIFAVGCIMLFFVYKFGIKEKSYEEALAEQRQQTNALLGLKPATHKPKENKKNKKAAKKAKEKQESVENHSDEVDSSEAATQEVHTHKKLHVEFKEEAEEASPVKEAPPVKQQKKAKKEKVRPILVKDKSLENLVDPDAEVTPANHFEQLHPKDEFELLRSNSIDELIKPDVSKVTEPTAPSKPVEVSKKHVSVQSVAPEVSKEDKRQDATPVTTNGIVANTGKEKKKKKSEFNTLQQLTAGDWNGPNMPILQNLVRKAELSRSEVQILIDLLLNKQHEGTTTLDEWSEGKSDPVQKLKKQLAEKENLLAEEQQALAGAQAKLREVRAEQQSEKSQLLVIVRQTKDELLTKQNEIGRLHQQLQQIQSQLKDEVVKSRSVLDELTAVKIQRQQLEMHLAQAKEADGVIVQLQQENLKIRNDVVVQLNTFKAELEQKSEIIRQFEEGRLNYEQQIHQQENAYKNEMSRLKDELAHLHQGNKQIQEELAMVKAQKEDGERKVGQLLAELGQLQGELGRLRQSQSNGALEDKAHEIKILNLRNELDLIKNNLQQSETKYETDLRNAASVANQLREELKEQRAKNDALRTRNWKVMDALNAAESRANKSNVIKSSQDGQREFVERLFPEIKELKTLSSETFQAESEKYIRKYVEELQTPVVDNDVIVPSPEEIQKLEGQIQHYKNAIDKTEKLLTNLQKHIEQEEINWRTEIAAKTAELEALKANSSSPQLKTRVAELEHELKAEHEEKTRILSELEKLKSRGGDLLAVEKLSEEVDRLGGPLGEAPVASKTQNCNNSTNGPALIQYCISSSSSVASSLGEVSITNKSKNKKKKRKGHSN